MVRLQNRSGRHRGKRGTRLTAEGRVWSCGAWSYGAVSRESLLATSHGHCSPRIVTLKREALLCVSYAGTAVWSRWGICRQPRGTAAWCTDACSVPNPRHTNSAILINRSLWNIPGPPSPTHVPLTRSGHFRSRGTSAEGSTIQTTRRVSLTV
jgi:hypothetical protein